MHNPHDAKVTALHLVFSSHFDAGCKTPGCTTRRLTGEPSTYYFCTSGVVGERWPQADMEA